MLTSPRGGRHTCTHSHVQRHQDEEAEDNSEGKVRPWPLWAFPGESQGWQSEEFRVSSLEKVVGFVLQEWSPACWPLAQGWLVQRKSDSWGVGPQREEACYRLGILCIRDIVLAEPLLLISLRIGDFPGGPVAKNLPSNAGVMGSIPGWGTKIPHTAG